MGNAVSAEDMLDHIHLKSTAYIDLTNVVFCNDAVMPDSLPYTTSDDAFWQIFTHIGSKYEEGAEAEEYELKILSSKYQTTELKFTVKGVPYWYYIYHDHPERLINRAVYDVINECYLMREEMIQTPEP